MAARVFPVCGRGGDDVRGELTDGAGSDERVIREKRARVFVATGFWAFGALSAGFGLGQIALGRSATGRAVS